MRSKQDSTPEGEGGPVPEIWDLKRSKAGGTPMPIRPELPFLRLQSEETQPCPREDEAGLQALPQLRETWRARRRGDGRQGRAPGTGNSGENSHLSRKFS